LSLGNHKKNETEKAYITKAIFLIDTQIDFVEKALLSENKTVVSNPHKKIQWTGSPMELVELVYALHETGSFGTTPLKMLFDVVGKTFGCEIVNYYRLFWNIRNRIAENRTFFLNKLQKMLSGKLDRMDSGTRS
jgi:hypothetical protein